MRRLTKIGGILAVAGLTAVAVAGPKLTRKGYESPPYEVTQKNGKFEVRKYATFMVVRTEKAISDDNRFMTLFRYIDGGNAADQKIAMTTPVFMEGGGSGSMGFVVPSKVVKKGVPKPKDANIAIGKMKGGTYAVLRFKGSQKKKKLATQATQELRSRIATANLTAATDAKPILAYYDPPWIPVALRKNEVLIRLKD